MLAEVHAALRSRSQAIPPVWRGSAAGFATAAAFVLLYGPVFIGLAQDWWRDDDASHGLLLAPLAIWIAVKRGVGPNARPQPILGSIILAIAVCITYVADLATEQFTLRGSMILALLGIVVVGWGFRQTLRWWLPVVLLLLCIPLPDLIVNKIAFPLQLKASGIGAALLSMRGVPVELNGNVINLPGRTLFVTEACSGLRSLSALVALGLLMGEFWLRGGVLRALILVMAVPVAVLVNGFRVFLTGFLVYYGDPSLGEGFIHWTEGWLLFGVAFGVLGCMTAFLLRVERVLHQWRTT